MGITKQELDEIKRLGLTHLAALLESVAGKEIATNLSESKDEKKVDMKGHFDAMFEGQELDTEFVKKAKTIFETAVAEQAELRLSEKFATIDKAVETQIVESETDRNKRTEEYLDYVVKEWLQENHVAIEANAKIQKASALIEGITKLLSENDITLVEATEEDKIAKALKEHAETQEELINAIQKINESEKTILSMQVEAALNEAMVGMDEAQARAFLKVASELTVESFDEFEEKLQTVSEAFAGDVSFAPKIDESQVELSEHVKTAISESTAEMSEADAEKFVALAEDLVVESIADFDEKLKAIQESFVAETTEADKLAEEKATFVSQVQDALTEATKDMADTEVEKFKALAEELVVENFEDFQAKLKTISESFVVAKPADVKLVESVNPKMESYIAAARSMSRKSSKK